MGVSHSPLNLLCLLVIITVIRNGESSTGASIFYNQTYAHIIVSGMPFERGYSHGREAKWKIRANIMHYKKAGYLPAWAQAEKVVEDKVLPTVEKLYPRALEEMRGIAKGSGVPLNDILILNSKHELLAKRREELRFNRTEDFLPSFVGKECGIYSRKTSGDIYEDGNSGAVVLESVTGGRDVLLGGNWNTDEFMLKNDTLILLEVHPDECEGIGPFVTLTEAGVLAGIGMNSAGLSLLSSIIPPEQSQSPSKDMWIPSPLLSRAFLEAPSLPLGISALLFFPRGNAKINLLLASGEDEALNILLSPDFHEITQVPLNDKEILGLSGVDPSHGVSKGFSSSPFKDRRVLKHLRDKWPYVTIKDFQKALKDHVGHPNSVCEHSDTALSSTHPKRMTVASIIFKNQAKTLLMSKGPPCQGTFKEFRFNFSDPLL